MRPTARAAATPASRKRAPTKSAVLMIFSSSLPGSASLLIGAVEVAAEPVDPLGDALRRVRLREPARLRQRRLVLVALGRALSHPLRRFTALQLALGLVRVHGAALR